MYKVKDHSDLVRDPHNNAIVNTNSLDYEKYISRRNSSNQKDIRVDTIESDLSSLKNEINEIKSLLKELVTNVK
tara:strand:- start:848 stop:1069 length:222 start_codon:yes stop_codon:yes gene_type:complete